MTFRDNHTLSLTVLQRGKDDLNLIYFLLFGSWADLLNNIPQILLHKKVLINDFELITNRTALLILFLGF